MKELINKSEVAAEIKRRITLLENNSDGIISMLASGMFVNEYKDLLSFLDTLEVKEINTWHLQEKEDIYDAVKDWALYTFACIMKDGTIQKFSGCLDEDCEGHINAHINGVNDDYDNVDDIVKWIKII